jgi:hypothetical protein
MDRLDTLGVPAENRTAWETGHVGVLLRTLRGGLERVVGRALDDGRTAPTGTTAAGTGADE